MTNKSKSTVELSELLSLKYLTKQLANEVNRLLYQQTHDAPIKRVYIRGCPRSGNTLMLYLCKYGFRNSHILEPQEIPVPEKSVPGRITFGTFPSPEGYPQKRIWAKNFLNQEDSAIIFMVRDPRDVLLSEHGLKPGQPWIENPQRWIDNALVFLENKTLDNHPRIIAVRFEDLLSKPNQVQLQISTYLGLEIERPFSDCWQHFQILSPNNMKSLKTVGPFDTSKIGIWKNDSDKKNYVIQKLNNKPEIYALMKYFGYDTLELGNTNQNANCKVYESPDRTASLLRLYPQLFSPSNRGKTLLYVGARTDRFDYGKELREAGYKITILEIFDKNVDFLRNISWLEEVILGDVRTWKSHQTYDVVFWWHGPEHIDKKELKPTLSKLEDLAREAVILGCPWGDYPQGHSYGNEHEEHVSAYDGNDFADLGYQVECLLKKDVRGSNITSVKCLNQNANCKVYESPDRTASLLRLYPQLFSPSNRGKTLLYVGARTDRFDYGKELREAGYKITILEIFDKNVDFLRNISWLEEVILGDVRTWKSHQTYDVVFWWHGPEHIDKKELKPTLSKLEDLAREAVILGCPWGDYPQGHSYGNEHEEHVSAYDGNDFADLGYQVECLLKKDVRGSNITSVKLLGLNK
ncbi:MULTISPECIES: hypothetical protein [unclassified Limnospira]|uniref:hypothetical protein n=1 Tax=unclassified Limnospira TaxID=2642885 RepID=UPI0028E184FE|nr:MULTISPECIES: hypothetical protein [unclassified Limnospira]MDT9196034.1 hypothetical protein [Limnospira sp. PMC 1245.20]MDT9212413.1 hypothetical protein [Limnospira sp. PMC 1256.20]MDT9253711.1 hypothetical protein [Limnospira sp. PMC 1254.20]MDT9279257.1 hypothetical protein [Limnospira sp. PMC 1293.21]MDT9289217.1 hypothetical protein [Limnospira sp. PMC 1295.21]